MTDEEYEKQYQSDYFQRVTKPKRLAAAKKLWPEPRECEVCGIVFQPHLKSQKICSKACQKTHNDRRIRKYQIRKAAEKKKARTALRPCECCGKDFTTSDSRQKFCCRGCRIETANCKRRK